MPSVSYRIPNYHSVIRSAVLKDLRKGESQRPASMIARIEADNITLPRQSEYKFAAPGLGVVLYHAVSTWYVTTSPSFRFDTSPIPGLRLEYISSLGHPKLTLGKPIPIVLEENDGLFSAWSADLSVYGYGPTEPEAIEDFKGAVAELFEALVAESAKLGPAPNRTLLSLQDFIKNKK